MKRNKLKLMLIVMRDWVQIGKGDPARSIDVSDGVSVQVRLVDED